MNSSILCCCCDDKLVRHINRNREYWFCRHCWQEMPSIATNSKAKENAPIPSFSLTASKHIS